MQHCSTHTKTRLLILLPSAWTWPTSQPSSSQECLVCNPTGKPQLHTHTHTHTQNLSLHSTYPSEQGQTEGRASPSRKNDSNSKEKEKKHRSGTELMSVLSDHIPHILYLFSVHRVGKMKGKRLNKWKYSTLVCIFGGADSWIVV